ncbi:MAG: hypothetical protein IKN14_00360 [Clostridiales bacterium]|nr:hypothetical protein [Clostridiales bacterium]
MKRKAIFATALCLSLMVAGCSSGSDDKESKESEAKSSAAATEESTEGSTEAPAPTHEVTVDTVVVMAYSDGVYDYTSVVPNLIVDGQEAGDINAEISNYIREKYPMTIEDDFVDGYTTSLEWGTTGNTVSIVIYASDIYSDYFTCEVFNFDLDTLTAIDDSEVAKRLGYGEDEFLGKAAEVIRAYCEGKDFDLDKCVSSVSFDTLTPFITSEGGAAVAATLYFAPDSQFSGSESVRVFNLSE